MSKENIERFMRQVAKSSELQEKVGKLGEEIETDTLIALGTENGCEFTLSDLHQYIEESTELNEDELEQVAGGTSRKFNQAIDKRSWGALAQIKGSRLSFSSVKQAPLNQSASGNGNNMMPQSAPGCSFD